MNPTATTATVPSTILANLALDLVRRREPDLSLRQLAVLSQAVSASEPLTVRGLAAELRVSKPAITRAMDRLEELRYGDRQPDPRDRRSVLFVPTRAGRLFIALAERSISRAMGQAVTA